MSKNTVRILEDWKDDNLIQIIPSLISEYGEFKYARNNALIAGSNDRQIHLREGKTRTINNSVTFDLLPEDVNDMRANFIIMTKMVESDGCGPTIFNDCKWRHLNGWTPIDVNIYEVLKYLKNPGNYTDWYFKSMHGGHYHEYGAEGAVMRMRRASNGALEGPVEMGSRNSDEYHRFWIRFELVP